MIFFLELAKLRRTGYLPTLISCALLSALIPAANTGFRPETFTALPGNPVSILLDANWEMMTMLTVLFAVAGACLMYHTEYSDRALQKMTVLPVSGMRIFLGKCLILGLSAALVILAGCASCFFCSLHWFSTPPDVTGLLLPQGGFSIMTILPFVVLMLVIASVCTNMWVSLGIGILFIFSETMMRSGGFTLLLLPFALPYQLLEGLTDSQALTCAGACAGELLILWLAALTLQSARVRRNMA